MKHGVIAMISFIVSVDRLEQVKESLILMVTDSKHQWRPSVVIRLWGVLSFEEDFHDIFLACCRC